MCYRRIVLFMCFINIVYSIDHLEGWNYINLHCRDNDNRPVDWWYMYKPPAEVIPFHELGRDFEFITSDNAGRWQHSDRQITANSMLQYTVAPMFRATYTDYLAVVNYEERKGNGPESASMGLLMADELGGVWIGHTVPGLIDLTHDRPSFPQDELSNGHLLMCISVDLITLNNIAVSIKEASPRFTRVIIPPLMKAYLPDWNFLEDGTINFRAKLNRYVTNFYFDIAEGRWGKTVTWTRPSLTNKHSQPNNKNVLSIVTKNETLKGILMIRKAGDKHCPYTQFAKTMNIVLDIYGHGDHKKSLCNKDYSVRVIDKISLKSVEYVHYVSKGRDKSAFAVSTAAHWQKKGRAGTDQYWTCVGPTDDASGKGGILMCVDNYEVWQSFDNFKANEPQC